MKVFFKSAKSADGFTSIESFNYANTISSEEMFRLVNSDQFSNPINFSTLVSYAESINLDVLILNDNISPKIVKTIDMQKHIYELKKAKKENDKKQKALQIKNKEIRISLGISPHDLEMKIDHSKKFADHGNRVKFLLKLRGREGTGENGKEYVKNFFNNVLLKFEGYNVSQVKSVGNSLWAEITK